MDALPSILLACGRWVAELTRGAAPALALLPPTCKQAVAHTAMVCMGASPAYYAPGFGPWPLAWGWCLLGALLGALASSAVLLAFCRLGLGHAPPARCRHGGDGGVARVRGGGRTGSPGTGRAGGCSAGGHDVQNPRRDPGTCPTGGAQPSLLDRARAIRVAGEGTPGARMLAGKVKLVRMGLRKCLCWKHSVASCLVELGCCSISVPQLRRRRCSQPCQRLVVPAECGRLEQTAQHAKPAAPSTLCNGWCTATAYRSGLMKSRYRYSELRFSPWIFVQRALLVPEEASPVTPPETRRRDSRSRSRSREERPPARPRLPTPPRVPSTLPAAPTAVGVGRGRPRHRAGTKHQKHGGKGR